MAFLTRAGTFLLALGLVILLYGIGLDFALLDTWRPWAGAGVALLVVGGIARWAGLRSERRRAG